jgi:hypothetical protein
MLGLMSIAIQALDWPVLDAEPLPNPLEDNKAPILAAAWCMDSSYQGRQAV